MSIHRSNENQAQQKSSESTKGKRIHELGWHWMKFNHANGGFSLTVTARGVRFPLSDASHDSLKI
ncbi:hypothetical protein SCA6_009858 [Theobroma cacao]